jgi:crotonobetainyl-CoA:carnitine CoA-transferase CaiB-like acyl-CoA transferase
MQVPSSWSASQPEPGGPAPTIGEHGRAILSEAGFTADEIDRLGRQRAVHLPELELTRKGPA